MNMLQYTNRMKKYFYLTLLSIVLLAVFLPSVQPALGLEVDYPGINLFGIPYRVVDAQGKVVGFFKYVEYFFVFIVITAGIFGVVSIVINGFKILMAFGSPEAISKAKTEIIGVILGIGLLFISVILLRTINPQLLNLSSASKLEPGLYVVSNYNPEVPGDNPHGVEFWSQKDDEPAVDANITEYPGWEASWLFYKCKPGGQSRDVLVWVYNDYNFEIDRTANSSGASNVRTVTLKCKDTSTTASEAGFHPEVAANRAEVGNENGNVLYIGNRAVPELGQNTASGILSFTWGYKEPGVYFYLTRNCTGISSYAQRQNGKIEPFDNDVSQDQGAASFKILNGSSVGEKYGVILTKGHSAYAGEPGLCTAPVIDQSCQKIFYNNDRLDLINPPDTPSTAWTRMNAAYVLKVAPLQNNMPQVTLASQFYRKILTGVDLFGNIPPDSPPIYTFYRYPAGNATSTLNDLIRPSAASEPYGINWFSNQQMMDDDCRYSSCLKKLFIFRGSYYVILYSKNYGDDIFTERKCQIFTSSTVNIQESPLLDSGRDIYKMYIVPSAQ